VYKLGSSPSVPLPETELNIENIGQILRHRDVRTTRKYAHVSMDAMRKALER
jgi:site-specific recombinase XerD